MVRIILNGSELDVEDIIFKKSPIDSEEYYHDCYVTFQDRTVERYDACDVTIIKK